MSDENKRRFRRSGASTIATSSESRGLEIKLGRGFRKHRKKKGKDSASIWNVRGLSRRVRQDAAVEAAVGGAVQPEPQASGSGRAGKSTVGLAGDGGASPFREEVRAPAPRLRSAWLIFADRVRVLAYRDDGAVLLVGTPGVDGPTGWRLPGGTLAEDQKPVDAAIASLYAETGLRAARWAGSCDTLSVETLDYRVHFFEAASLRCDADHQSGMGTTGHWFDLDVAVAMAIDGRIEEALSALQILRAWTTRARQ